MDQRKVRAWWSHRQGLDGSLEDATPEEVLNRSGWARSVGGVGPYLSLYSRAGTSREDADTAVRELRIHELPSARGCTYVVPADDFALALKVGQEFGKAAMKTALKLGVTAKEIEKLCDAVVNALGKAALTPDEIRAATGSASRSLGEEGKKKGLTTTLPLALGELQAAGEIRRVPSNGRLDQQRYQYTLWRPNPLQRLKLSTQEAYAELAKRFFRWIGPATLVEFQWFSGLGVKASKAAVAPLNLIPIEHESERLMLEEDLAKFSDYKTPQKPHYVMVSSLDAIHALRRDVKGLVEEKDTKHEILGAGDLSDLSHHAILDRGQLVGLWEYDTKSQSIVAHSFKVRDKAFDAAIAKTELYIRDQLGDARSFSLDSPQSRAPRIEALRNAG